MTPSHADEATARHVGRLANVAIVEERRHLKTIYGDEAVEAMLYRYGQVNANMLESARRNAPWLLEPQVRATAKQIQTHGRPDILSMIKGMAVDDPAVYEEEPAGWLRHDDRRQQDMFDEESDADSMRHQHNVYTPHSTLGLSEQPPSCHDGSEAESNSSGNSSGEAEFDTASENEEAREDRAASPSHDAVSSTSSASSSHSSFGPFNSMMYNDLDGAIGTAAVLNWMETDLSSAVDRSDSNLVLDPDPDVDADGSSVSSGDAEHAARTELTRHAATEVASAASSNDQANETTSTEESHSELRHESNGHAAHVTSRETTNDRNKSAPSNYTGSPSRRSLFNRVVAHAGTDAVKKDLGQIAHSSEPVSLPEKHARVALFRKVDMEKNGFLGFEQARLAVAELYKSFRNEMACKQAFNAADRSGAGALNRREFRLFLHYLLYFWQNWESFEQLRPDRFSCVTATDFQHHSQTVGLRVNQSDAKRAFSKLSFVGTAAVSFDTFCAWCAKEHLERELNRENKQARRQVEDGHGHTTVGMSEIDGLVGALVGATAQSRQDGNPWHSSKKQLFSRETVVLVPNSTLLGVEATLIQTPGLEMASGPIIASDLSAAKSTVPAPPASVGEVRGNPKPPRRTAAAQDPLANLDAMDALLALQQELGVADDHSEPTISIANTSSTAQAVDPRLHSPSSGAHSELTPISEREVPDVCIGMAVTIFSSRHQAWARGVISAVQDDEVKVAYEVGGEPRQKWVDILDEEVLRLGAGPLQQADPVIVCDSVNLLVGQELQIFSSSYGSWGFGVVQRVQGAEAKIIYNIGNEQREKWVDMTDTEKIRPIVTDLGKAQVSKLELHRESTQEFLSGRASPQEILGALQEELEPEDQSLSEHESVTEEQKHIEHETLVSQPELQPRPEPQTPQMALPPPPPPPPPTDDIWDFWSSELSIEDAADSADHAEGDDLTHETQGAGADAVVSEAAASTDTVTGKAAHVEAEVEATRLKAGVDAALAAAEGTRMAVEMQGARLEEDMVAETVAAAATQTAEYKEDAATAAEAASKVAGAEKDDAGGTADAETLVAEAAAAARERPIRAADRASCYQATAERLATDTAAKVEQSRLEAEDAAAHIADTVWEKEVCVASREDAQIAAAEVAAITANEEVARVAAAAAAAAEAAAEAEAEAEAEAAAEAVAAEIATMRELMSQAIGDQKDLVHAVNRVESMAMASTIAKTQELQNAKNSIERLEGLAMVSATSIGKLTKRQADGREVFSEGMQVQAATNASKFEKTFKDQTANIKSMLMTQAHSVSQLGKAFASLKADEAAADAEFAVAAEAEVARITAETEAAEAEAVATPARVDLDILAGFNLAATPAPPAGLDLLVVGGPAPSLAPLEEKVDSHAGGMLGVSTAVPAPPATSIGIAVTALADAGFNLLGGFGAPAPTPAIAPAMDLLARFGTKADEECQDEPEKDPLLQLAALLGAGSDTDIDDEPEPAPQPQHEEDALLHMAELLGHEDGEPQPQLQPQPQPQLVQPQSAPASSVLDTALLSEARRLEESGELSMAAAMFEKATAGFNLSDKPKLRSRIEALQQRLATFQSAAASAEAEAAAEPARLRAAAEVQALEAAAAAAAALAGQLEEEEAAADQELAAAAEDGQSGRKEESARQAEASAADDDTLRQDEDAQNLEESGSESELEDEDGDVEEAELAARRWLGRQWGEQDTIDGLIDALKKAEYPAAEWLNTLEDMEQSELEALATAVTQQEALRRRVDDAIGHADLVFVASVLADVQMADKESLSAAALSALYTYAAEVLPATGWPQPAENGVGGAATGQELIEEEDEVEMLGQLQVRVV